MPAKRSLIAALVYLLAVAVPAQASSIPTIQQIDLNPMAPSSQPGTYYPFGNKVYFLAEDGVHGQELWGSDGAPADGTDGSEMICDLRVGALSGASQVIGALGDWLYFVGNDGTNGGELYRTNGSVESCDIVPINASGDANVRDAQIVGDQLWFSANDGTSGDEPWLIDNNAAPVLVHDILNGPDGSEPSRFTRLGSYVYFAATDGTSGTELWRSDGTTADIVADITTAAGVGSYPYGLIAYDGRLYFAAHDITHGYELWSTDGASPAQLIDVNAVDDHSSNPNNFTLFDGSLYFTAYSDSAGQEWWRTDGVSLSQLADLNPGANGSSPSWPFVDGDYLYFQADNGVSGSEMWRTNGTATQLVKDLAPGASSSYAGGFVAADGGVLFAATDGTQWTAWITNGTAAGTFKAVNLTGANAFLGCECDTPIRMLNGRAFTYMGNDAYGYEPAFFDPLLPATDRAPSSIPATLAIAAALTAAAALTLRRGARTA